MTEDIEFPFTFLIFDEKVPSPSFRKALSYISSRGSGKNPFSHIIMQQEFGLTPIMWQMVDLARWLKGCSQSENDRYDINSVSPSPNQELKFFTVVHTPRAYPRIEEIGVIRQLARWSDKLIVMSWHAFHSLKSAYGISQDKIVVIPHGVSVKSSQLYENLKDEEFDRSLLNLQICPHSQKNLSLQSILRERRRKVILSNGLVHKDKGLDRVIRALPELIKGDPSILFVIAGQEHPMNTNKQLMQGYLNLAQSLDLGTATFCQGGRAQKKEESANISADNVTFVWINAYLSDSQLKSLYSLTSIYVTMFEEVTPTSGTLLAAMANGLAIASTPFNFAVEMLADGRGIVIPEFPNNNSDCKEVAKSLARMLSDSFKQELAIMRLKAKEFASKMTWKLVASEYTRMVFGNSNDSPPLITDIFHENEMRISQAGIYTAAKLFNGKMIDFGEIFEKNRVSSVISLYVDPFVQINIEIGMGGHVTRIGIIFADSGNYLLEAKGNEVFSITHIMKKSDRSSFSSSSKHFLSKKETLSSFETPNIKFKISAPIDTFMLQITSVNRFASPSGLLGSSLRSVYDKSFKDEEGFDWRKWQIKTNSPDAIFESCDEQKWSLFGISVNVLPDESLDNLLSCSFKIK